MSMINYAAAIVAQDSFISYGGIIAAAIGGVALIISTKLSRGVKPTMEALHYIQKSLDDVKATGLETQRLTTRHLESHSKKEY